MSATDENTGATRGRTRQHGADAERRSGRERAARLFTRVMARAWAPRENLSVSAWAQKHRVITLGDNPGPWRNAHTPYLEGIMDAFADDDVRTITIKKGSQTGGTEALYNMIFWAVCQRPGLIMFIYPDADSAADQNAIRFLPACHATAPVRDLLSPRAHDLKSRSLRFLTCTLLFRGSFSEHKIESLPAPYVIVDELDRCPPRTAHLASQRGKTYTHGKVVFNGKPGLKGEGIDAEYEKSDQRTYRVPCPHCGVFHERTFAAVRWAGRDEKGRASWDTRDTAADADQVAATACLKCQACRARIDAGFNHWQLRRGVWIRKGEKVLPLRAAGATAPTPCATQAEATARWGAAKGIVVGTPRRTLGHAGFHLPELLSGLIHNPYAPVARAFVERGGRMDPDLMADHLGEAWSPVGVVVEIEDLRRLAPPAKDGGYRMGVVPEACRLLLAAVDVQESSAYVEVRAFGPHGTDRWLVWAEQVPCPEHIGLAPLDQVLYRRVFTTASGRVVPIHLRAIDSGDRTDEVYEYCLARPRIVPVKGVGTERGGKLPDYLHKWSRLEIYPDGRKMRGSVHLLRVNTHVWKSVVQRRLRLAGHGRTRDDLPPEEATHEAPAEFMLGGTPAPAGASGPGGDALRGHGAWHFPEDVGDEYLRQLTAEECLRVIEKHRVRYSWRLREGRRDNHYFDCAVYAECLADALGVRSLQDAPPPPPAAPRDDAPTPSAPRSLGQALVERARGRSLLERRRR